MASSTAPISLVTWIQDRITALYRATSPTAFDAAFDALLHDSAQIHVNGVQLTRDEYKRRLQAQRPVASSATVAFSNIVHVPGKVVGNQETGSVGIFYQATVSERTRGGGHRSTDIVTSSLNAIVTNTAESGTKVSILTEVWMAERAL